MSKFEKIVSYLLGGVVLLLLGATVWIVAIILMIDLGDEPVRSTFVSPSGNVTIIVEESCFGFGCSQVAYLKQPLRNKRLGDLSVGDPENTVFDTASVRWDEDETEMRWPVSTRHGTRTGVISVAAK